MQVRPRGVAAITALWFVVCGVLAMQHEASTVHARDRAGGFVHAVAVTCHQTGTDADIHGLRDPDAQTGDCTVLTTFHQAASAHTSAPVPVTSTGSFTTDTPPRRAVASRATAVYRLAPKTSPPAAA